MEVLDCKQFFNSTKYKIYCDMDGVLTDWVNALTALGYGTADELLVNGQPALWRVINRAGEDFWSKMDWRTDGKQLWNAILPFNPTILSSPSRSSASRTGKIKWCKEQLGSDIKVILTYQKGDHATPNSILIDDTPAKCKMWTDNGGICILHTNTEQTLSKLYAYLKAV